MRREIVAVISGDLLDEECDIGFAQLCRACALRPEVAIAMVEEGILTPRGERVGHWRFTSDSIRRSRLALRLQRDLDLNLAGAALVLNLLDRIGRLESMSRTRETPGR